MAGDVVDEFAVASAEADFSRRALKVRRRAWAQACAAWLTLHGVSPNAISLFSAIFAAGAGLALLAGQRIAIPVRVVSFVAAAAFIQLRLICNLMDGMVAIEGGRKSSTGEVWNDLPDRLSDIFIFTGAGYGLSLRSGPLLGWVAATLALLTAYVRLLAGTVTGKQRFLGPMAKQHRMALMTAACLVSCFEPLILPRGTSVASALLLSAAGSLLTVVRRLQWIRRDLES